MCTCILHVCILSPHAHGTCVALTPLCTYARTSQVRSTAVGLCSSLSRAANFLSSLLPILLGSEGTLVVIAISCGVGLPLSWFCLPETRGRALE